MATFFSDTNVGTWSGYAMTGTLTGTVSRSGNTVTLSGMSIALRVPAGQAWGDDNWSFTVNGTSTSFHVYAQSDGYSLGSYLLNNTSINVLSSATSANISWVSGDGVSGTFTITFPAGSAGPKLYGAVGIEKEIYAADYISDVDATSFVAAWNRYFSTGSITEAFLREHPKVYFSRNDSTHLAICLDGTSNYLVATLSNLRNYLYDMFTFVNGFYDDWGSIFNSVVTQNEGDMDAVQIGFTPTTKQVKKLYGPVSDGQGGYVTKKITKLYGAVSDGNGGYETKLIYEDSNV